MHSMYFSEKKEKYSSWTLKKLIVNCSKCEICISLKIWNWEMEIKVCRMLRCLKYRLQKSKGMVPFSFHRWGSWESEKYYTELWSPLATESLRCYDPLNHGRGNKGQVTSG